MFVQFISDSSNGGQGFKIRYEAKSLGKCFLENSICTSLPPGVIWFGDFRKENTKFSEVKVSKKSGKKVLRRAACDRSRT